MSARVLIGVLIAFLAASGAPAADYTGKVQIVEEGKPAAAEEYADAVAYFIPKTPGKAVAPLAVAAEMRMENKTYVPRVLPITQGSSVNFANFDPILHNAFSTSTNNTFDLGLYGGGESQAHVFNSAGLVRVYCNVHHSMVGYLLVLDTPYYSPVAADGSFTLKDLPDAPGELFVWQPRADVTRKTLDLAQQADRQGEFRLELTQRRLPKHLNKEGKSYRKSRDRSY
jgi:plastocyanin